VQRKYKQGTALKDQSLSGILIENS